MAPRPIRISYLASGGSLSILLANAEIGRLAGGPYLIKSVSVFGQPSPRVNVFNLIGDAFPLASMCYRQTVWP